VISNPESPQKLESRVVCETEVTEDMLNPFGSVHGACLILLIDECSTLPLSVVMHREGRETFAGVSQTLNTVFHAPASLGTKLKIISTTISIGKRAMSCQAEIWDADNKRLVATGIQTKMIPSTSFIKPKL